MVQSCFSFVSPDIYLLILYTETFVLASFHFCLQPEILHMYSCVISIQAHSHKMNKVINGGSNAALLMRKIQMECTSLIFVKMMPICVF